MKRKLIKRNKRWLMEKYHLSQQLVAPLLLLIINELGKCEEIGLG